MEEEEIPEPSVLDFSLEESLRTCVQNLGQQELPHPTARDLLQEQNVRTLGGTAENKGPADLTTEDPLLDDEIFILVLYPSDDYNAPLLGRKERLQLTPYGSLGSGLDDRGYEAISYTWGTNAYGGLISIDGNDLPIPFNLELALLRIRDDEQERRIWVDAVCINTPNLVERSHRFSKVRQIFQNAETVLIWLGEESENNPGALRFLSSTKTWNMSNEPSDKYLAMMWQSLQEFLMHAYFTRVCVVQEIVVARRIIVLHGTDSLDWTTMREAITIFYRRLVDRKIESEDANAKVSRAISFVSNIDKCSHWIGGHGAYRGTWSPALNLEELVFMFSTTESSDPRNKIHSLLSIAVDVDAWESNERFPEDSRTWEEIQKVFYMSCMKYSQSLDVIFRPWRQHQSSPWLLHQANDSEYTASLIGAPPGESPYSLFRGYTLSSELKSLNVLGDDRIHTSAYLFDEVETVTDAHDTLDVPLPRRWLSKIGRLRGSQFVHNLLPKTIEEDHETIFKLVCFLKDMANDSENDEDYFRQTSHFPRFDPDFKRLHALTKGRRLFKSKRWSVQGFGPASMRIGDSICFSPHCSVPIVLRNIGKEGRRYKLIGTCYVRGYMSGQVADLLVEGMLPLIELTIPFELNTAALGAARVGTHVADNKPTKGVFDRIQDPGTNIVRYATKKRPVHDLYLPRTFQSFRMCWTCACGYKGVGHYLEYRPGAMNDLALKLQNAGHTVVLQAWDPFDLGNNLFDTAMLWLLVMTNNLWKQCKMVMLPTPSRKASRVKTAQGNSVPRITTTSGTTGKPALASVTNHQKQSASRDLSQTQGNASQSAISSSTSVRLHTVPSGPSQVAAGSSTNPSSVTIPSSSDFIHVCFKVGKYLKLRHDLQLNVITRDRELFAELRRAYAERFTWAHRMFSLKTVQKIKFVKFKLWRRNEVDNLKYGVPPVTEQHYAFEPNPPDYEPVLDNDFLMHRFTCSVDEDCLEDAVCLERIPKRIDRPVPWNHSDAPDLGIGWGLQLEEGYSNRVCMAFLVGILVSAIMGVVWSIVAKDLQSGFVVASWMVTSEAIMVGAVQLLLIFRAI